MSNKEETVTSLEKEPDTQDDTNDEMDNTENEKQDTHEQSEPPKDTSKDDISSLLNELGVSSVDDLKNVVKELNERKEAELSETEKLENKLNDAQKRYEELQEQLNNERLERRNQSVRNTVVNRARDLQANNPEAVSKLILDDYDKFVGDDNTVNEKAVNEALEALKDSDSYLFKANVPSTPSNNNGKPKDSKNQVSKLANAIKNQHKRW